MKVLLADLDEYRARVGKKIHVRPQGGPASTTGSCDAVAPRVAEGLDLLRFARDVGGVAVADVAARGGPLEVGVELDAVGRVDIDALDLAAQALALGQRGHDLQAVAQDHAVRPVSVVFVKVGTLGALR